MKRFTLVAMAVGSLTLAPAALAQDDAVVDAYGGKGPAVVGVTEVLGATETGGGEAVGGTVNGEAIAGAPSGTAGVSGSAPASSGAPAAPVATASAPESVPSGSLPFTGLDLGLIAAGGLLLLGLGVGMRRLSSQSAAH